MMKRRRVLEIFAKHRTNEAVMLTASLSGSILGSLGHVDPTMYNVGFTYASPECLGLALRRPDMRVVAIEGDGSTVAGLGHLTTIFRYQPKNLVVIVMDNEVYMTASDGPVGAATATSVGVDLAAVARAVGIEKSYRVEDYEQFEAYLKRALAEDGPWYLVCKVDDSDRHDPAPHGVYPFDRVEQSMRFRHYFKEHPAPAH